MNGIIIFCQAPADIRYVLQLYQSNIRYNKVTILVVNVYNNYRFLKSLNLNADILFIPLVGQKNTFQFINHIFRIKRLYKRQFHHLSENKIYFFANNYDYVTAYFINKLKLKNSIIFCDIYMIDGPETKSIGLFIKKIVTKLFLGINIKFYKIGDKFIYQYIFDEKINHFDLIFDQQQIAPFKFKIDKTANSLKKNILFFESNEGTGTIFINYENTLTKIIEELTANFNVYIKPHPRQGYSKLLNNYNVHIVNDFIPAELLDVNDFSIVLGIVSTSIVTVEHKNKFSLINLFEFKEKSVKNHFISYLTNLSKDELSFVSSIDEVLNACES